MKAAAATPAKRKSPLTLDIGPLFETQWTGIPVFTRRLVQALAASGELELSFAYNLVRVPNQNVFAAIRAGDGAYLSDAFASDETAAPEVADPGAPVLYPSNKGRCSGLIAREASTVHDMTTLFMPDTHDEGNVAHHLDHLHAELMTDEAIFCISEATRASLIAAAPSVAERIRLISQYVDWPESFELTDRNLPTPRPRRYALVIGTIEPRKNLGLLIHALAEPEVTRLDLVFVVLGKQGWLVDEFLAALTQEQRARVVFSGFVSEFVKYRLIKGAQFLIFPSLCEGFGIPALEAMSLGKPVLASLAASLPEVIGDAGVYFDPLSVSEFAAALAEIANPLKLKELAPRAFARNAEFTPERMAAPVVAWAKG
jgi:glycosyltransferase involved in cell wall biosynthesis